MAVPMHLPEALASLVARLEGWNFALASEERGQGFGDRVITLTRSPLTIKIVADRDQWFVELAREDWDDWFDPDVWRSCLDGSAIPNEPRPLIAQSRFVVGEIDRIAAAGERLLPCLREARAARSRRRLSLDE